MLWQSLVQVRTFYLNLFQETVSTPFLIQRVFSFKSLVPGIREESHQAGNSPPPSEIRLHLRKWRRTVCAFWHIFGSQGAFQDTSTLSSEKSTVHCGRSSRNNCSSKLLRKCCKSTKFSYFHKYFMHWNGKFELVYVWGEILLRNIILHTTLSDEIF